VSGQLRTSAALPLGKEPRYQLDRRLGGPQRRSRQRGEEKILGPQDSNSDTSVVQPVGSRYTDYAIPVPQVQHILVINFTYWVKYVLHVY
jgi:hypothetical protein